MLNCFSFYKHKLGQNIHFRAKILQLFIPKIKYIYLILRNSITFANALVRKAVTKKRDIKKRSKELKPKKQRKIREITLQGAIKIYTYFGSNREKSNRVITILEKLSIRFHQHYFAFSVYKYHFCRLLIL